MKIKHDVSLVDYTSLHAGGQAATLIELETGDNLKDVVSKADKPVWVLGFGTNVLISDKGLPGTVIINRVGNIEVSEDGKVKADSGTNWDDLVVKAIDSNLWGLEFTSGIPGGVGAAIAGNIAAYGHQISSTFVEATMLDDKQGTVSAWHNADFDFKYRTSNLKNPENSQLIVLDATFQLSIKPTSELEYKSALKVAAEINVKPDSLINRRKIIMETRKRAGSLLNDNNSGPWTAGSFFKNPFVDEDQIKSITASEEFAISQESILKQNVIHGGDETRVSAAHVLLAAGFKRGQSWGNVRLHPEHILKVENMGEAKSQDIYNVVQEIIQTVNQKLGITLEPEVRFLGEFN